MFGATREISHLRAPWKASRRQRRDVEIPDQHEVDVDTRHF